MAKIDEFFERVLAITTGMLLTLGGILLSFFIVIFSAVVSTSFIWVPAIIIIYFVKYI